MIGFDRLFLSPHNDDETLFGAFTIMRYQPHVIVCTRSEIQTARGATFTHITRTAETRRALVELTISPSFEQWEFSDITPDYASMAVRLATVQDAYELCFAPAVEENGHDQHNEIGRIAQEVFGDRYRPYLTYRRGYGRSVGREVSFEPGWPARKLRALGCYESQIAESSTAYWFIDSGLREYTPET